MFHLRLRGFFWFFWIGRDVQVLTHHLGINVLVLLARKTIERRGARRANCLRRWRASQSFVGWKRTPFHLHGGLLSDVVMNWMSCSLDDVVGHGLPVIGK